MAKHVLLFTKELVPNQAELDLANTLDGDVTFRCIKYVDHFNLEVADAVAGLVPGVYAEARTGAGDPVYPAATTLAPPAPMAPGAAPSAPPAATA